MNEIIEFITKYNILPLLIALFGGAIILAIALTHHPGKKIAQEYERIRGELQEKKRIGFFDYYQINKRLISNILQSRLLLVTWLPRRVSEFILVHQ